MSRKQKVSHLPAAQERSTDTCDCMAKTHKLHETSTGCRSRAAKGRWVAGEEGRWGKE
jgi:hypothetical protein